MGASEQDVTWVCGAARPRQFGWRRAIDCARACAVVLVLGCRATEPAPQPDAARSVPSPPPQRDRLADGCPASAPASWVGCEDFDAIDDPRLQLGEWLVFDRGFELVADDRGGQMLAVHLRPHVGFGGWVTLRVGAGPESPQHGAEIDAADEHFDALWLRYRLRTVDDWPGHAIGDFGELIAMDPQRWAIAAEIAIRAEDDLRLAPLGWSCIEPDGRLRCDGRNDWRGGLRNIWRAHGTTTWFDAAHAGTWRCIEAYVRLDEHDDGEAQVWIDGELQAQGSALRFRGPWRDAGLNALRFTSYTDPPPRPLSFFIDEVVFATARVGCE